jgi:branched-chain amino acid transport system permease protein
VEGTTNGARNGPVSTLVIGASVGMLLYILAAGLNIIFGMLGVVNFAHGSLYMLGAFVAYQSVAWTGSFWVALVVAPLLVGAFSIVLEMAVLRPVYRHPHYFQFLLTFGLVLVLDEVVRVVWGVGYKIVDTPPLLAGTTQVFGAPVPDYRLFVIGSGVAIALALHALLERSLLGTLVRATSENPAMAACIGVDVAVVRTLVFGLGGALAALAGVFAAPLLPVLPGMGLEIIIDCFIVVVIGGLGNMSGTIAGALLIGMARAAGQTFAPDWVNVVTYSILILALLLRPQGLFGQARRLA